MITEINTNILLFNERGIWIAQCLDYDLNGQGSSIKEAIESITRVISGSMISGGELREVPEEYLEMAKKSYILEYPEKKYRVRYHLDIRYNQIRIFA